MIKAVVLHNYVVPHSCPLLRELAKKKDLDLEVFYMAESARNRRWRLKAKDPGFKYKVLPSFQLSYFTKDLFAYIINPTIIQELARSKYDVVISDGWLDFSCQASFLLTRIQRKKYILWSESTVNEPSWRRTLAMPLVRTMMKYSDAYLARGTRAKEYLESLGANPQKLFIANSVIDNEFFHKKSQIFPSQRKKLKEKLGINPNSIVVLYVGQLIDRKGIVYLIKAFSQLEKKYKNRVSLLIQGYGPQKEELLRLCNREKTDNVIFSGHVEVDEIPKIYAIGNIFVLPSYEESWGRVVNEAMACGLPIITTRKVGASVDLVKPGVNGFIVREKSSRSLENALNKLIKDEELRDKMGKFSWRIISQSFTPSLAAEGVYKAIKFATKG